MNVLFDFIKSMGVLGIVIMLFITVICWPLIIIWALNTVFSLSIAYTFWNWLAMLILLVTVRAKKKENANG